MDQEKIMRELSVLERGLKSATNPTLKTALEKKITRLKNDLEGVGMPAHQLANKLLKAKAKVKALTNQDFKEVIRRLSSKPEYAFLKSMTVAEIKDDLDRPAKPVGWRFKGLDNFQKPSANQVREGKKNGTVYYENRRMRSDVSKVAQLGLGGTSDSSDSADPILETGTAGSSMGNGGKLSSLFDKAKKIASKGYDKSKKYADVAGKKVKVGYDASKKFAQDKIHDQKKKLALEVIDDTKDKVSDSKHKMLLKGAEQMVAAKYDKGGSITSDKYWEEMPPAAAETQAQYWSMRKMAWNKKEIGLSKKELKELQNVQEKMDKFFPQYNHYFVASAAAKKAVTPIPEDVFDNSSNWSKPLDLSKPLDKQPKTGYHSNIRNSWDDFEKIEHDLKLFLDECVKSGNVELKKKVIKHLQKLS